ncbi:Methyltransferase-like protein 7B [Allomyces javanicus]|nr:Methyltransferase-like protein 7B [Allomyces javanicus]
MAGKSAKKSSSNKRPGPPPRAPPARATVPPQPVPPAAKPSNPVPPASASAPSAAGSGSWWSRLSPRGKAAFAVGGLVVYGAGVYGFYQLLRPPTCDDPEHGSHDACHAVAVTDQPDRRAVYDEIARDYDREISRDEWAMGMLLVRRWMVGKAQGNTLEIAAGTGRNLPYYRTPRVTHLTLSDTSSAMLAEAANRIAPNSNSTSTDLVRAKDALPISLIKADATRLPFESNQFDTVVSTMSLCSVHDPTLAVREAVRVTKPGGRVLLVEHGRGHYDWLNRALDRSAAKHAEKWGCYFHRPIGQIVEAAVAPVAREEKSDGQGMAVATEPVAKIASVTRLHLGTTWLIEIEKTRASEARE